jgi:hypothetical protein
MVYSVPTIRIANAAIRLVLQNSKGAFSCRDAGNHNSSSTNGAYEVDE